MDTRLGLALRNKALAYGLYPGIGVDYYEVMIMKRTNTFLGKEYRNLVKEINQIKAEGISFNVEIFAKDSTSLNELSEMMACLTEDTGLSAELLVHNCRRCGKMHVHLIISQPEEDECCEIEET